jgi:tRNA (guanine37-N1)-methyltransferase
MKIDIITLFPEMCETVLGESIIGRAQKSGSLEIKCHQLRDYALDKHRRVDDTTYGGGMGMLMKAEPIALCFEDICRQNGVRPYFIYMSPRGTVLTQEKIKQLSELPSIAILCGHYEGIDERVLEEIVTDEVSIGDYVLTGGELAAQVITDSVARLLPGSLRDASTEEESFENGLLEYPQYTQPAVYEGAAVPEVLRSGDHEKIRRWRLQQSLLLTRRVRPDLFARHVLTDEERRLLEEADAGGDGTGP